MPRPLLPKPRALAVLILLAGTLLLGYWLLFGERTVFRHRLNDREELVVTFCLRHPLRLSWSGWGQARYYIYSRTGSEEDDLQLAGSMVEGDLKEPVLAVEQQGEHELMLVETINGLRWHFTKRPEAWPAWRVELIVPPESSSP